MIPLRRPKDILCLTLFVVFIIFMGAIAIYGEYLVLCNRYIHDSTLFYNIMFLSFLLAWVQGEPLRIIYPTDSKGRLCGVDPAVA